MKKTFGIFAHVDAGKTTFSEQLLYHGGCIQNRGRVDHKDTFLDTHELEKKRGITIFLDQATFAYEDSTYFLIDTPGHVDFSAEMERCICILDYAILLISGTDGVQSHTETVWKLLQQHHIPTFFFINKMDVETTNQLHLIQDIKKHLSNKMVVFHNNYRIDSLTHNILLEEALKEEIVEKEDILLEAYLEDPEKLEWNSVVTALIQEQKMIPCMFGSALMDFGIDSFFECFHVLSKTSYDAKAEEAFTASVYKIQINEKKERLVYIKVLSGTLKIKDEIAGAHAGISDGIAVREKVNQIYLINGTKKLKTAKLSAGDLGIVVGIMHIKAGEFLHANLMGQSKSKYKRYSYQMMPAMQVKVLYQMKDQQSVLEIFRILEEEEPQLKICWDISLQQLRVHIMGKIQLEILKDVIANRFDIQIEFDTPEVLYLETIKNTVMGYGHFEPLRHYAEVALRLEPNELGSGISCKSECHVDTLSLNYQNAILKHIKERMHRGVLIGAEVTDLHIVLITGISHIKHTEAGDFREAVYRAIRQGLEKAESILLEPMYHISIQVPLEYLGKVLADINKLSGKFEAPIMSSGSAQLNGVGPVATWMNYGEEFLSYTKGKGKIQFKNTGYDTCHNMQEVILRMQYKKEKDLENTSCSVFCKKGSSFVVKGKDAEAYMHCLHS